jgi:hypothetical protein
MKPLMKITLPGSPAKIRSAIMTGAGNTSFWYFTLPPRD